ncbi:MAG: hypothetical protein ABIR57_04205 [Aeromicrobium sp.]
MRSLHITAIAYAVVLSVVCVACAARHRRRPAAVEACLTLLAGVTVILCLVEGLRIANGSRPDELATHIGYLVIAPLVLPATAGAVQLDGDRWGSGAMAVGCLVLAVVLLRLAATSSHA